MLSFARGKERCNSVLKELRLQKQALPCALGVTRHSNVKRIDERLNPIGYVLDLYVRQLRRAHAGLERVSQSLFALLGRIVIIILLTFRADVTRELEANVAFECPILTEDHVRRSLIERFLGSCHRSEDECWLLGIRDQR